MKIKIKIVNEEPRIKKDINDKTKTEMEHDDKNKGWEIQNRR